MSGSSHRLAGFSILLIFIVFAEYTGAIGLGRLTVGDGDDDRVVLWLEVITPGTERLTDLRAALAPAADFEREGIPWDPRLQGYRFTVETERDRPARIRIEGPPPAGSPLPMLVEVRWSQGRLLREIEVPPRTAAGSRAPAPIPQPPATGGHKRPPQPLPPTPPTPAPASMAAGEPPAVPSGGRYVVRPGDTLYGIVRRMGAADPAAAARRIFAANPRAFAGRDMNRLLAGATLDLDALPAAASSNSSRQPPEPEPVEAVEPAAGPELEGEEAEDLMGPEPGPWEEEEETHAMTEPGPPAPSASEDDRNDQAGLHILAPDEGADEDRPDPTAAGTDGEAWLQALGLARELAESRRQEAEGLRAQLQQLELLVERQEKLIALQAEQLAALQERLRKVLEAPQPPTPQASAVVLWTAMGLSAVTMALVVVLLLGMRRNRRATGAGRT